MAAVPLYDKILAIPMQYNNISSNPTFYSYRLRWSIKIKYRDPKVGNHPIPFDLAAVNNNNNNNNTVFI